MSTVKGPLLRLILTVAHMLDADLWEMRSSVEDCEHGFRYITPI